MARGISLHIGLNSVNPTHYSGWSGPLQACENDAISMAEIASSRGFEVENLLTEQATRDEVIRKISHISHALEPGDFFFLTYSGHGGQVPDRNDDERDRQDETWCLFDAQLIDDEIFTLLSRFKSGVRILVLSDSCHSGTVLKNKLGSPSGKSDENPNVSSFRAMPQPTLPYRIMPQEIAKQTYDKNAKFYDPVLSDIKLSTTEIRDNIMAHAILISGCQDNQLSIDGTFNGVFTGAFLYSWNRGAFEGNYHELYAKTVDSIYVGYDQTPNYFVIGGGIPEFETQSPLTI